MAMVKGFTGGRWYVGGSRRSCRCYGAQRAGGRSRSGALPSGRTMSLPVENESDPAENKQRAQNPKGGALSASERSVAPDVHRPPRHEGLVDRSVFILHG